MGHAARQSSLALAIVLIAGCSTQAAPPASEPTLSAAPSPSRAGETSSNPCSSPLAQLGAFTTRIASDIAALRPLVVAKRFSSADAVTGIRRVSATLTAYGALEQTLRGCEPLVDLAATVKSLRAKAEATLAKSRATSVTDAKIQRAVAASLFGLLPKVLALAGDGKSVADSIGADMQVAEVPSGATKPLGSLPPLATSRPQPTPRFSPQPTPAAGGGSRSSGSGWTSAAANTANVYVDSALQTWAVDVAKSVNALYWMDCTGMTGEECYYIGQEGRTWANLASASINTHLAWMNKRPAATCFRDAYAADRAVAKTMLPLFAKWYAGGSGEMRYQNQVIGLAYSNAETFLKKLDSYFSDCP